jgi:L-malate glycosyltransferase
MTGVHQVLTKLADGDAIGHEVIGIQRVLRNAGYESEVFVEVADAGLAQLTYDYRALRDFSHRDNLLIHHFSVGSDASKLAYSLPDRMLLVYHNITPAEYFVSFHPALAKFCYLGRRELRAYARRCTLAVGDSEYNRRELEAEGFPRTAVLPVVPDFRHLDVAPSPAVITAFDDDWTNFLFVGRIVPNKKIEDLIRFFHAYQTLFNRRSRLLLVGSTSGLDRYVDALVQLIHDLGQQQHVILTGHVSNAELTAYYDVADLFLCASEHEGFCVPLVEAFYKQVPVMAYDAAAVPSTMDGAGVLYESRDPFHVATMMDDLLSNVRAQENVVRGQRMALERLMAKDFGQTLLEFVDASRAAAAVR